MVVPTIDQLLRPMLKHGAKTEFARQPATEALMKVLSLFEEELQKPIHYSGATKINSHTGWAMTHLTKGRLIHKVARYTYKATDKGVAEETQHLIKQSHEAN